MKDRLVTLFGALGALLLFVVLFGGSPTEEAEPTPRPTSIERGEVGLAALADWLGGQGIPVQSLRERYQRLPDTRGNVLIVSLPPRPQARFLEAEALAEWVGAGNTLLLLAALQDTQAWSFGEWGGYLSMQIEELAQIEYYDRDDEDDVEADAAAGADDASADELDAQEAAADTAADSAEPLAEGEPYEPRTAVIEPLVSHPLFESVERLEADSPFEAGIFVMRPRDGALLVELARDRETGGGALWQRRAGDGQIIVSGYSGLFANATIGRADNREFAANLFAYTLGAGGKVIFDDMHQGLSSLYDPQALFSDARLYRTLGFILSLWLLWLVGASNRFAAPAAEPRLGERDFIEASGGLLARLSGPLPSARRLFEQFFNELRGRSGRAQNGEPCWELLRRSASLDPKLRVQLERQYALLGASRRPDPRRVHNLLLEVRRNLQ